MKKAHGINYNQREIVLVPFPYSDLTSTKKRPVLIVSNNDYNNSFDDVIVCVITSNTFKDNYSIDLMPNDLEYGILPEASVIKTHKLFTINKTQIIKKFSVADLQVFAKVEKMIHKLIKPL